MFSSLIGWVLLGGLIGADSTAEWHHWRGPLGTGEAGSGSKPPIEWSESKNIRWKVAVPGNGTSSPIVVGEQVILLSAINPDAPANPAGQKGRGGRGAKPTKPVKFEVISFDRKTGKILWETPVAEVIPHEGHHPDHGFASFSPISDGEMIYAFFGSRGLFALDLKGNIKWSKDLGKMSTRNGFGEGSSPALFGNTLIINWDHEQDDFIAAFDKRTGKEIWRTERDEPTSWTTPLIASAGGKPQVIVPGTNQCVAYDLETGKKMWQTQGLTANVIPTGIVVGDMAYLISGFRGAACLAIKLPVPADGKGDDAIVWKWSKGTPYVPSPTYVDGKLYFFGGNTSVLTCIDAKTGKPVFESQRVPGLGNIYTSPIAANGHVYLIDRAGNVAVIEAGPEFKVIAKNQMGEPVDASPAAVGGELLIRGKRHLFCIAAN